MHPNPPKHPLPDRERERQRHKNLPLIIIFLTFGRNILGIICVSFFLQLLFKTFCDNEYLVMHVTTEMCTEMQQNIYVNSTIFYLILIKMDWSDNIR